MAPKDEIELIQQVGMWADTNFGDKRLAEYGIAEEVGETFHCLIKRFQGIRGFDNEAFFLEKLTDALCDIMIYLADYCYIHNSFFKFERNRQTIDACTIDDERKIMCHLQQAVSTMLMYPWIDRNQLIDVSEQQVYNAICQRVCTGVEMLAKIYGIDLRLAVAAEWVKNVSKRDWVADPQGAGGTSTQEAGHKSDTSQIVGMRHVRRP